MIQELSTLRLELDSRAESPAIVRAALAGVAQAHDLDAELFDDVKTAVTEACNNVVLYAYPAAPGPYVVQLEIQSDLVTVSVRDWGAGIQQVGASEEHMGVGLAVISALADRAEFSSPPEGGTEVRMTFAARGGELRPFPHPAEPGAADGLPLRLRGDVVVSVSPPGLLAGVLGRVSRAVAGRTGLSLDRFGDIDHATEAIAAFTRSAAGAAEVTFAAAARGRGIELTVGPFPPGEGARGLAEAAGSSPAALAVAELAVERVGAVEVVRVVIDEGR